MDGKPRHSRLKLYLGLGLLALLGIGFILCCSGLPIPIFSARNDLALHLTRDFGISLPASAVVDRGSRIATRDPAKCFLLQVAPAELDQFLNNLQAVALKKGHQVDTETPVGLWTMGSTPGWWQPISLGDAKRFDISIQPPDAAGTGYIWFYSPSKGTVYVFGFST